MHKERGPIDIEALQTTERIFQKRLNGLIEIVEYAPNVIDPVELRITLHTGFNTDTCRFDIQWWENNGYKYHYVEDGLEFRFGWEIRPTHPDKHFHPPEALTEHRESCIAYEEAELVTFAVLKCWWDALQAGDPSLLNEQENPP